MPMFEGYSEHVWKEAELNKRLLPRRVSWSCECPKRLFVNPNTICPGCDRLEHAFWMGKGERSLQELRSYVNGGCQVCRILLCGLDRFQQAWRQLDEKVLRIWLWIQPNNAVYLQVTSGRITETSGPEDILWLEFYTTPGKLRISLHFKGTYDLCKSLQVHGQHLLRRCMLTHIP
jgi:hypothetical protein